MPLLEGRAETDLKAVLTDAKPLLWQVSTSGAKKGGNNWGQLIQTLDRGDYDQKAFFKMLRELGFQGNVGFQCYAIRGDSAKISRAPSKRGTSFTPTNFV